MKTCTRCKVKKNSEAFYKHKRTADGLNTRCKLCDSEVKRQYYVKNRDSVNSRALAYNKNNALAKKKRDILYRQMHSEEINAKNAKYYLENRSSVLARRRVYQRQRRAVDPIYKLQVILRKRINGALKGNYKTGSAVSDLGCSVVELKQYLENKFQPGMTWNNWSKTGWHIDHIRPLSSFDLTIPSQFKQATHFSNLQPLWAKDNLKKGSSVCL